MAERVQGFHARQQVRGYVEVIEKVKNKTKKNFEEMDFENANRRQETEEIIEDILSSCETTLQAVESITFE